MLTTNPGQLVVRGGFEPTVSPSQGKEVGGLQGLTYPSVTKTDILSDAKQVQLRQMKSGIITWVCTNSPTARDASVTAKSCVCMPNWLNNLEPVTSHQEI